MITHHALGFGFDGDFSPEYLGSMFITSLCSANLETLPGIFCP
jgi:hypothetical protein